MKRLHVHIIFEHGVDRKPFGVAYIRDILPLTHPVNSEAFEVTQGTDYALSDVVIIERTWKPGITLQQAETLVDQVHTDRARLVYTIDDNLLDLEDMPLPARMAVLYFCRAADGILVSTQALKERLSGLSRNIFIIPNMLDERLFIHPLSASADALPRPIDTISGEPLRIGFMGTFTHDVDLMSILQALRTILRKYTPDVEMQLLGGIANPVLAKAFQGLPFQVLRLQPDDIAYPNFIPWMRRNLRWDLGLAPLENTRFNLCKSDIKFLDYSALGIPGIYSRVPSYEATVQHLETGWLAENIPAAWAEAIEALLSDVELRTRLAHNAQEVIISRRTLQDNAHLWREAIQNIASSG